MLQETQHQASIEAICAAHGGRPEELLEILHEIQDSRGFIAEDVIPVIARLLNLSRADVHGVVTFYHDFKRAPHGRHVIKICRAESCQAMDGRRLCTHAEKRLGTGFGQTTADGKFTLEAVYCLGNCALSPAIMIDGRVYGRVNQSRFDELLGQIPDGASR